MWDDTLLAIERAHVLRLLAWGGLAAVTGLVLCLIPCLRRTRSKLLRALATQHAIWGMVEISLGVLMLKTIGPRDLARATALMQTLWLEVWLAVGALVIGLTLILVGWYTGRREGVVGAGLAVAIHGVALVLLHLRTIQTISSWL